MEDTDFHKRSTQPTLPHDGNGKGGISVPEKIGPYRIESLLERGGMSLLYLGTHPDTKEPTAIKVLSERFVSNPEVVKRFLDEAGIISLADHPNIVKLFGHGEWEGGLYIAMEFVEGISLRQYLLRHPLSLKQALEFITDIAYALCHLHTHGVIHRDLKPENVLVTHSGSIKLIDFGIAQLLTGQTTEGEEEKSRLLGTPIYMSPEQKANPANANFPSDIYSLGIVAYELILGKLCHGRIHLSLMPKGLQGILSKMLQPKSQDRFQDVVDLINEITNYTHSASFKKESLPIDQLSELGSSIKLAEQTLIPQSSPRWHDADIGIGLHKGVAISGIYYDFFQNVNNELLFVCIEPVDKGIEGVIFTAVARGIIRTLIHEGTATEEIIPKLNHALCDDQPHALFQFSFGVFSSKNQAMRYLSSGNCGAWVVTENDPAPTQLKTNAALLGSYPSSNFDLKQIPWNKGSTCVFSSFTLEADENEEGNTEKVLLQESLSNALKEHTHLPADQMIEGVLRKVRILRNKLLQKNSLLVVGIQSKAS